MNLTVQKWMKMLEDVLYDARYAFRVLLKNPAVSLIAIISLALGIGANTLIFSIIDSVLFKSLPVERPNELFQLARVGANEMETSFAYPALERFRAGGIQGTVGFARRSVRADFGQSEQVSVQLVSDNYFSVLGVRPKIGRLPDMVARGDSVSPEISEAVISHALWNRQFAGDPSVIGRSIVLDGASFRIVGVLSPSFYGLSLDYVVDVWIPIAAEPLLGGVSLLRNQGQNWVEIVSRIGHGATDKQLASQADFLFQELLQSENGSEKEPQRIIVLAAARPLTRARQNLSTPLFLLIGIVFLVLMIACANIANLLSAKAAQRRAELTIRTSLGASRGRLVRQLLTESIILACFGGGAGLAVAYYGNNLLLNLIFNDRLLPGAVRPALTLSPNISVLAFTLLLSITAGILFGLAPALRASRIDLMSELKHNTSQTVYNDKLGRGRLLLISQLAISLLLLIMAGSFVRSLQYLVTADLGFQPDGVVRVKFNLDAKRYTDSQFADLWNRVYDDLKSLPEVVSVSMSYPGVYNGSFRTSLEIDGVRSERANAPYVMAVTPGFFSTLNIPIVQGRGFTEGDHENAPGVALMSEAAMRRYLKGENPVGRHIRLYGSTNPIEVIGVVKDMKPNNPTGPYLPIIYTSLPQTGGLLRGERAFDIRGRVGAPPPLISVRRLLNKFDAYGPSDARLLTSLINRVFWVRFLVTWLAGLFGLLGLALACIGEYGLISYAVARQTREIGMRIAFGASPGQICWLIWSRAMLPVSIGIGIGLIAAIIAIRAFGSILFGLTVIDSAAFASAMLALGSLAALAAYLPARRASRMEASVALRYE